LTGGDVFMESLLFLAHRLPFPPNKGDKVRSFHFLKHLAGRYRVFLGTFIDDPADWQHVESVKELCAGIHIEPLVPWSKRARSATCLVSGEPLTLPYFRSRGLRDWVQETVRREGITRAFTYSSPMAQYALEIPQLRCVADFVDMDSAKWSDYADRRVWPVSALYRRESVRLLSYERSVAARAAAITFVTEEEATLFRNEVPECAERVVTIRNGVDAEYFSPVHTFASPFAASESPIVFTGAMDYWPNVDAVVWFAREVLPEIRRRNANARFYVVGMNPDVSVCALASDGSVAVTGRVDDVRPYLEHAGVVVAPMRVARGIQNKVLEAMAMAKAVVVTTATAAALSAQPGVEFEVAGDPREFAAKVAGLMGSVRASRMGELARARVLNDYGWAASLKQLDALLERVGGTPWVGMPTQSNDLHYALPTN
jgi:sugar transferase (PEP-CTERM/EpsH1 system associated)